MFFRIGFIAFSVLLLLTSTSVMRANSGKDSTSGSFEKKSRTFNMALTPFPYAYSRKAIEATNNMISDSADSIMIPFSQGIPWEEALEGKPFPESIETQIKNTVDSLPPKNKIILSVSPLNESRDGVADDWNEKGQEARSGEFANANFSDPNVIKAYTNFCKTLIKRFKPTQFVYCIEPNMILRYKMDQWKPLKDFCNKVYTDLKAENPKLPIMFSIQLDEYYRNETVHREKLLEMMRYTDYIAVTTYPYVFSEYSDPAKIPADFFSRVRDLAADKPFAITETGYIAENLIMDDFTIKGDAASQKKYLEILLNSAEKEKANFVCWYISRDFDELWDSISKDSGTSMFKIWKDTGLLTGDGNFRQSFNVWLDWLNRQKKNQ